MGFADRLAGSCHTSHMEAVNGQVRAVEYVGSLAGATGLGSDLFRARDHDGRALKRAYLEISLAIWKSLKWRGINKDDSRMLAHVAIAELLNPHCHTCHGGGTVGGGKDKGRDASPERVCPSCGGVGVHRWLDAERAEVAARHRQNTGGGDWARCSRHYAKALSMAQDVDSRTVGAAKKRLG